MNETLEAFSFIASSIAAGDLTREPKPQSERDDLGNAFSLMTSNLRSATKELFDAVSVLSESTALITSSTSQVSASIAETAAAVSETTATVEEVKLTSQLSRDKGREVAESAQKATDIAHRGERSVKDTIAGMGRIREQMDSIGASMLRLGEQTQAIGDIIATVNDLAEQSNVLAVNAAIEAAKAGEHGKSFGIVAQEVRSLAEQSKQATSQVRTILNDIQKAATHAMTTTEQGSNAVDAGLEQARDSGESIASLARSIADSAQAACRR
jgi:methyl-accepting chemotaxis protein